jgi:hypothetical protein
MVCGEVAGTDSSDWSDLVDLVDLVMARPAPDRGRSAGKLAQLCGGWMAVAAGGEEEGFVELAAGAYWK